MPSVVKQKMALRRGLYRTEYVQGMFARVYKSLELYCLGKHHRLICIHLQYKRVTIFLFDHHLYLYMLWLAEMIIMVLFLKRKKTSKGG